MIDTRNLIRKLVLAFENSPASEQLPSKFRNATLLDDIDHFLPSIASRTYDLQRTITLCERVIECASEEEIWDAVYDLVTESPPFLCPASSIEQTPWQHNTNSFVNSAEHRRYVDDVLKEELGPMHVGVPGFFKAFFAEVAGLELAAQAVFEKCKEGDNPSYREGSGWQSWPEKAREKDVLSWFAPMTGQLLDFAEEHQPASSVRRRPLAQPHQPLEGSTAERKLDVGFVDDPYAGVDSKYHWSQILVPGELKSNPSADMTSKAWLDLGRYARKVLAAQDSRRFVLGFTLCGSLMRLWEFDRLGGIASTCFNINQEGQQFVSAVLGFLWMNKKQLGFDPTISTADGIRYIEIERNHQKERLVIDKVMKRASCVAGRATTCWKAYLQGDDLRTPLVIKDSWQFPEREEEGELLREATDKKVVNVARYYHHETVCIGGYDDDICGNVRKGLDITKAENYKPMPPPRTTRLSTTRQKRSSSCTDASLPPSKRTCSSSSTKAGKRSAGLNRVHRRVIVRDYGKAIYKASSRVAMLNALIGCIDGYESLHTRAGMLHRDISMNNLIINEDDSNPSRGSFLIDLDLAVNEQREKPSGARGMTGTRAFMAIGVLFNEKHSFMHDLESFFWVLFWICIHFSGPHKGRCVKRFDKWHYLDTVNLVAAKKAVVDDQRDFLRVAEENFTHYYQPLIPWVNTLRRVVFPGGQRWEDSNPKLYSEMKSVLRAAREDPKVLAE